MVMSQINMTSITSLVLLLALTTIHAQNECLSGSANCINIRNCPQIISILTDRRPPSAQMLQTLRNLQCGFESNDPKYCCNQVPTTTTTTVKPEIEFPPPPDVTNHPNLRLLDHQACGPVPEHKVISGNKTELFQYPWVTRIVYGRYLHTQNRTYTLVTEDPIFFCEGSIISSRYVLTAAGCFNIQYTELIGVRVGDHDISKERDCITDNKGLEIVCAEKYQDFGVDSIHRHPGYLHNLQDDIGLIRLNASIDFTPRNVKPICLPFGTAATLNHKRAIVIGWDKSTDILLQAKLPLVTNEWCTEMYKNKSFYPLKLSMLLNVTYKQLCVDVQENGTNCLNDVGAPLQTAGIYNGGSVRIIQHGLHVYNPLCIQSLRVYTRVSFYMDWILNTMTD